MTAIWRATDRESLDLAARHRAESDDLERRQHLGRLLLQAKTHAAPFTILHSSFAHRGPDVLRDAEWDAEALMAILDALHAELSAA